MCYLGKDITHSFHSILHIADDEVQLVAESIDQEEKQSPHGILCCVMPDSPQQNELEDKLQKALCVQFQN